MQSSFSSRREIGLPPAVAKEKLTDRKARAYERVCPRVYLYYVILVTTNHFKDGLQLVYTPRFIPESGFIFSPCLYSARSPQSAVRSLQSTVRSPQSTFRSPQSAVRSPRSTFRSPRSTVRGPQSMFKWMPLPSVCETTGVFLFPKLGQLFCLRTRLWITLALGERVQDIFTSKTMKHVGT